MFPISLGPENEQLHATNTYTQPTLTNNWLLQIFIIAIINFLKKHINYVISKLDYLDNRSYDRPKIHELLTENSSVTDSLLWIPEISSVKNTSSNIIPADSLIYEHFVCSISVNCKALYFHWYQSCAISMFTKAEPTNDGSLLLLLIMNF